ncbi:MAG: MFS transporter [Comamonadaceae bacterium]|nr:MAG: MFS transporter [Comamonadaceae bacterium]
MRSGDEQLDAARAAVVFLAFALAYFLSTLVRGITATLSPVLTQEFALDAQDLGLLAGGYFLGFALTQLPLGGWLDRHGPRRMVPVFLCAAVAGCLVFAAADSFWLLLGARVLAGIGLSACLMGPLTGYRRWLSPAQQMRCNSWMLMVGSAGLVASTLPVGWVVPLWGWRPLFVGLSAALLLAMLGIAVAAPRWRTNVEPGRSAAAKPGATDAVELPAPPAQGYAPVWRDPFFRRAAPLGFFNYGGFIAMQTLWIVPWLTRVNGQSPTASAQGLFVISLCLLAAYWVWGLVNPWLARRGVAAARCVAWCLPISLVILAGIVFAGPRAGVGAWVAFCLASTVVTLVQPAVALALPASLAGRALSAYNLVVFAGVFAVQWGFGFLVDAFGRLGLGPADAFRGALAVFLGCSVLSYLYFLWAPPHNAKDRIRPNRPLGPPHSLSE